MGENSPVPRRVHRRPRRHSPRRSTNTSQPPLNTEATFDSEYQANREPWTNSHTKSYLGSATGFGWPYALVGLAWAGILGFSLLQGAFVGFLIGAVQGVLWTGSRLREQKRLYQKESLSLPPTAQRQLAALGLMARPSILSRIGFWLAVGSLAVWAIVAVLSSGDVGPGTITTPNSEAMGSEQSFKAIATEAGLPESMPFDEAKAELLFLITEKQDSQLEELKRTGIDLFADYPYCMVTHSTLLTWSDLISAKYPEEFSRYFYVSLIHSEGLENTIIAARTEGKGDWSPAESKRKCIQFENEERARRGLPTSSK
jgi:hypothetical protein